MNPLVLKELSVFNPATGDLDLQIYVSGECDGWVSVQFCTVDVAITRKGYLKAKESYKCCEQLLPPPFFLCHP